jgi:uncharacterized heparinase superfamily protein
VNCGLPALNRESWREVARATNAHSTVTFNNASSCEFLESGSFKKLIGFPIVAGPVNVPVAREDRQDGIIFRGSHDGYAKRFGVIHQRTVMLGAEGNRLEGVDVFIPARGEALPSGVPDEYVVRFHLHPTVKANRHTDGHGVMLMLPNREAWTFNAYEDTVDLEESVYLAGNDGPRRAVQIVIYGNARRMPSVHWTFLQSSAPAIPAARRKGGDEPQLPL